MASGVTRALKGRPDHDELGAQGYVDRGTAIRQAIGISVRGLHISL